MMSNTVPATNLGEGGRGGFQVLVQGKQFPFIISQPPLNVIY
jgi:hypothetical protein